MTGRAGQMREVIKIQERSRVQDDAGEESWTWTTLGERQAEKLAYPGREVWSAKERSARVPTVFRCRYPREFEVQPKMRIVNRGKTYDITSAIDEDGRQADLLITCEELVGEPP